MFPVLGCSEDPTFYQETQEDIDGSLHIWAPQHSCKFPFGSCYGYMTQLGVVSVVDVLPAQAHGYIHDEYGWVLHAKYPDKERDKKENKAKDKGKLFKNRREKKEKVESR